MIAATARKILLVAAFAVPGACAGTAVAATGPGLVGEWRFDELGGDAAVDRGPYGLDGRLGAADGADAADPARIAGLSGGALRFDGASYVRLPDARELAVPTLTAEAVVRAPSSPGSWRYVLSRGSQECFAGSYGLYTGGAGGIAIYVFDGSRYAVSATARAADVWDGAWHHVAGTFDGTDLRLFVDGRPVGEPLRAPLRIDYARTTRTAAFGRYVGGCDLAFQGDLDVARLWSGALSAGAIAAAAGRPADAPGPAPPLAPAAPPTILPAGPRGNPTAAPGAPPRACALRLSRTRIAPRRRTAVRVRVTVRGRPARAVRVVAKRRGTARLITAGRTGAHGRVRLRIRAGRPGRLRISAATSPRCSPAYIRVARGR